MDEFFLRFENCDKQRYQSNVGAPTQSDFDGSSLFYFLRVKYSCSLAQMRKLC